MVNRVFGPDRTVAYQISGLVYEYLSTSYPPDNGTLGKVRGAMRAWQAEQDKNAIRIATYRYAGDLICTNTQDEQICAQHLRRALIAAHGSDFDAASKTLSTAVQLTPTWWEVYRIKARILEWQYRPIYEIEEAYEYSITCNKNDINLYHYSTYLTRINQFERAVEKADEALQQQHCLVSPLRSIKGLALMRWGKIPEAIIELEAVWDSDNTTETLPIRVMRTHGTQLADAHRRRSEQLFSMGKPTEGLVELKQSVSVLERTIKRCGPDHQVAELAVEVLIDFVSHREADSPAKQAIEDFCVGCDANSDFRDAAARSYRILGHFERSPHLKTMLPKLSSAVMSSESARAFYGTIKTIVREGRFGFITCADPTINEVHFSDSSLVDRSQWVGLSVGASVTFRIIRSNQKGKLPHAIDLR